MGQGEHEHTEAAPVPAAPAVASAAPLLAPAGPTAGSLTTQNVLALQRTAGNAAVNRAIDARSRTEAVTGFDLSSARITRGSAAADALGVDAVTVGHDVHLGSHTPGPGTAHGDHVIAHELAHVVQQSTGHADLRTPGRADALEREAEQTAQRSQSATPATRLQPLPAVATPAAQAYDPRYHRRALVHGLNDSGFNSEDIGKIYAANWERDMSQAHPALAAVALRWKELKIAAYEGERPLQGRIDAFNGSVDACLELGTLLKIKSGEAYGGYRFYEHMDNPGAEPELDPSKAKDETDRKAREAHRAEMLAMVGDIPQYMADGRDYIKAQLVRAAEAQGATFDAGSEAGKTRDAWAKREEALKKIVPHDRDRPVITGQDPNTDVIAKETAHQAEELRKSPPGTDYDGEKVVPPTPAPDNTPAPTPDPSSNGNGAAPLKRHPLSGPVFNTEVDRRFWAQNPEKAGQRLDPKNPDDAPYVQKWLRLRDQVRAQWKNENDAAARAAAEEALRRQQEQQKKDTPPTSDKVKDDKPATPHAADLTKDGADALGRASHALEDFWSHSNFVELTLGIKLGEISPGKDPLTGKKGDVNDKLQTSTFSGNDTMHSLSHKIRAVADEIDAEWAIVNRVSGKTDVDPSPEDIKRIGSEAPPTDTEEPAESIDEARENDPVMKEAEWTVKKRALLGGLGGAVAGGLIGARIGSLFGPLGVIAGGVVGGLAGGLFGAFKGAQSGIKKAMRETIATPRGVGLLRRLAEGLEQETRANQEEGGHTQIAKDQPGHDSNDPLNQLRTLRFNVSQECAVRADKEVIAAMRGVMDAPADKRDGEIAKVLAHVDKLIGPPKGHPYEGMVKAHQKEAEDAMVKLKTAGEGSTPAPVPSGRP